MSNDDPAPSREQQSTRGHVRATATERTAESERATERPSSSGVKARVQQLTGFGKQVWQRLAARPGIAHIIRAGERFTDRLGNQFAAAITYFSFLSLVPTLMVGFSIGGFVLSSRPDLLGSLKEQITDLVPDQLGGQIGDFIDQAVDQRLAVGIIGLAVAFYSGLSWMGNVRDALRAQWRPRWSTPTKDSGNILLRYVADLVSLAGLAVGIIITFALTAAGTALQDVLADWWNVPPGGWVASLLRIGPFAVAIAANVVVFGWVYAVLPERAYRADRRTLLIGALTMAIAFEILKTALTLLVTRMSSSPSGVVFGSVIGLLLFFNLAARVFLAVGAWMATSRTVMAAAEGMTASAAEPAVVPDGSSAS